jgi:DNA-binding XRE family transcriptional regulator
MPARTPLKSPAKARRARTETNNVRRLREARLLTKAELARMAGISALTLARIEAGHECRVDTQRKVILALGLKPTDRARVFGDARGLRVVR